jgi:hypothetical protein
MTDQPLSPAAQAVLDASNLHPCKDSCLILAAALRALAVRINGADAIRQDILAIAAELEAQ